MAIQLGTFNKLDDGVFAGTINTLNVSAGIAIGPGRQDQRQSARLLGLRLRLGPLSHRNRCRLEPGRQGEWRDLHQPQDRSAVFRTNLAALPPRQGRRRGRRLGSLNRSVRNRTHLHPHRPLGTSRLTRHPAAPPVTRRRGSLFFLQRPESGEVSAPRIVRTGDPSRRNSQPVMANKPPQRCAASPHFAGNRESAPARGFSGEPAKPVPPRPAARRLRRR